MSKRSRKMMGYSLLHYGAQALARVEHQGIRIDVAYLEDVIPKTRSRISEMEKELSGSDVMAEWRKRFQDKTKLGSRIQLAWVMANCLGIDPKTTDKGNPKTDEASLSECRDPFVQTYLRILKLKKAVATYLVGIQRETVDGFLHPFFNLHTVTTYRSSSDSPNFQNIPSRDAEIRTLIRRAFIPRKGNIMIEADYGGIEVRVAACYHRDPKMIDYLLDDAKDLHRDMAEVCFLLPRDEMTPEIRYVAKNQFVFPEFYGSWWVSCAKGMWAAVAGGMKIRSGITVIEHLRNRGISSLGVFDPRSSPPAGTFLHHIKSVEKDFWGRRFKAYAQWKDDWYAEYQTKGFLELLTGFVCRGFMRRNEVINYPVQGSAFHCLLWSLIQLVLKELPSSNLQSLVVGQIHDSVVGDVPVREAEDYRALVEEVMISKLRHAWDWIIIPLEVEFSCYPDSWAKKEE